MCVIVWKHLGDEQELIPWILLAFLSNIEYGFLNSQTLDWYEILEWIYFGLLKNVRVISICLFISHSDNGIPENRNYHFIVINISSFWFFEDCFDTLELLIKVCRREQTWHWHTTKLFSWLPKMCFLFQYVIQTCQLLTLVAR